jgi:hypothetical protein
MKTIKKIIFAAVIFTTTVGLAQEQNTALTNTNTSQDYLRPSLVFTTLNFNNVKSMDLEKIVLPAKFDMLSIDKNTASLTISAEIDEDGLTVYDKDIYKAELDAYVKGISGQIIAGALSIENGAMNFEKLYARVANSLTENQRNTLKNLTGGLDDAANAALLNPALENIYLMVVSPTSITTETTVNEEGKAFTVLSAKAYETALYRVHVGKYLDADGNRLDIDAKRNQFNDLYLDNLQNVSTSEFPVEQIYSKILSGASGANMNKLSQAAVIGSLLHADTVVEEFRPRAKIEKGLKIALGTKEGLKVDDRYFSYQKQKDPKTRKTILVRKGVDRVKKVGNNNVDLIANPEAKAERTSLYPDSGKLTRTGYLSIQAPEWGLGVSAFYRMNPGVRLDYRLGSLIGVTNTFFYIEGEFIEFDYAPSEFSSYSIPVAGYIMHAGFQKTFNVSRMFAFAPYAQYEVYGKVKPIDGDEEIEVEFENPTIAAGLRAIVKYGTSLQFMPEVTYVIGDSTIYDKSLYIGFAIRYNL